MSRLVRIALCAFCLGAAALMGSALLRQHADARVRRPPVDVENTYYRQPQLLDHALAQLERSQSEQSQLFFVGFAGYGAEAVFKREVLAVRRLFDERFGTNGRSLALINHASTLADTPLANASNLERALQHIGGLMNPDHDMLFLFLTSHGQKGLFVVDMPGFGFNDLIPEHLKAMLDRSGIKNRVVVVSACHSGSFIPTLADPTTLLITAAHADRTSFGCADKRQWTYFGDAYFNRALRQERSFLRAFELAKRLIRDWEAKEKLTRSLPQLAGGEALQSRLEALAVGN